MDPYIGMDRIIYNILCFSEKYMRESSFKRAVQLSKQSHYEEAIRVFTQVIDEHPANYAAYLNRGSVKLCTSNLQSAIEDFDKAIWLEPFEITAYYNRFVANYKLGNKKQSQKDIYIALSLSYGKRGQQLKSAQLFNKAISLVKNNVLAHLKRGNLFKDQHNYSLAQNDYTEALLHDNNNVTALSARASLYKLQGRQQQAEEDVQRIAQLMKQQQHSSIKLVPRVQELKEDELEIDIQSKLRQFGQLRSLMYKLDAPDPLRTHKHAKKPSTKDNQEGQDQFRIFNSFSQSSNNQSANQDITNKVAQVSDRTQQNDSVKLKQLSEQPSQKQANYSNSHITQRSQQYQQQSKSQFKPSFNKSDDPSSAPSQPQSKNAQQQKSQPQRQSILPLEVEPYSKLQILVISAEFDRDIYIELFENLSPYVQCEYNGWAQKTEVAQTTGKHPTWNEKLKLNYVESAGDISFRVFDKAIFKKDNLVCEADIKVQDLLNSTKLTLCHKKEEVGVLQIKVTVSPSD